MLSFLSPCTLPLLPLYLSYITGKSVKEVQENDSKEFRRKLLFHSIFFLLGVSVVYLSLGLGVSYLGNVLTKIMTGSIATLLQRLAGIFMVVLGLVIGGWLKIPMLLSDTRKNTAQRTTSYASSFLIGLGFAAGWTPCIALFFLASSFWGFQLVQLPSSFYYYILSVLPYPFYSLLSF